MNIPKKPNPKNNMLNPIDKGSALFIIETKAACPPMNKPTNANMPPIGLIKNINKSFAMSNELMNLNNPLYT